MAGIKDYSTTAASNTSVGGVSIAEGMLPSNINNAFRAITADIREWFNDSQWVEYGDGDGAFTAAYASATSFTIAGTDVTSIYHANRRIKLTATTPGTIYGTISSSSFSTNTTVNVTWDSGSLANEAISNVYIGILSQTNTSIPGGVIGSTQLADGSVTTAKLADLNVTTAKIAADAVTNAKIADDAIDSEHYTDGSIDTAHIADSQITTAKLADTSVTTAKLGADSVTNAKIADDSIDSEHYVDGSIDTAHIADSQVTLAKMAADSVDSSKIVDGSIVNADINASAAIDATKISGGAISNTEFGYLNGVTSAIQTQLDGKLTTSNNLSEVTASTARTNLGLGTIATQDANSVTITGGSITGMSTPSSGTDVTTKTYVDDLVAGLKTRIICRVATTGNVDLAADLQNGDTLDGITLATGDRVLVKDQTSGSQNGIYTVVASGTAGRDTDFDSITELAGQLVITQEGSTNADKIFLCTTDTSASLGSSTITFSQVQPSFTGTVTSVAIADAGSSEFTVTNSPITTSGTINLAVNNINVSKITDAASKGFATAMAIAL